MAITRKLWIALFLVSNSLLSFAWVMVSPVPSSYHRTTTRLWCDEQISDDSETSRSRRCVLQQLGLLFPAAAIPAACAAAEVIDPFAAMDDIISAEIGKPSTVTTTPSVTPVTTTNADDSRDKEDSNLAPSSQQSDMEKALQEAKQRKNIAPRTHG